MAHAGDGAGIGHAARPILPWEASNDSFWNGRGGRDRALARGDDHWRHPGRQQSYGVSAPRDV